MKRFRFKMNEKGKLRENIENCILEKYQEISSQED